MAARSVAVLDPLKLVITNYPEGQSETCTAPRNPHDPEAGQREFPLTRELWIERDDFREEAPKKYFRLFPGNTVRLKYGYVVRCTGFTKNEAGEVVEVRAEYLPDTKSGTPGADSVKVKGNITWSAPRMPCPRRSICMTACSPTPSGRRRQGFPDLPEPELQTDRDGLAGTGHRGDAGRDLAVRAPGLLHGGPEGIDGGKPRPEPRRHPARLVGAGLIPVAC